MWAIAVLGRAADPERVHALTLSAGDGPVRGNVNAVADARRQRLGNGAPAAAADPLARVCDRGRRHQRRPPMDRERRHCERRLVHHRRIAGHGGQGRLPRLPDVGPYVEQWWDNQPDFQSADELVLEAGMHAVGNRRAARGRGSDPRVPSPISSATRSKGSARRRRRVPAVGGLGAHRCRRPLRDQRVAIRSVPDPVRGLQRPPAVRRPVVGSPVEQRPTRPR